MTPEAFFEREESVNYTAMDGAEIIIDQTDKQCATLVRHIPERRESAIRAPLNSTAQLLSPDELAKRNQALAQISRMQNRAIPDIIVN